MVGAIIGLVGVAVAIGIPLTIERLRRPALLIEHGSDANQRNIQPHWRIVHVRVINHPITGLLGKWLLRHVATGCRVRITFVSRSDRSQKQIDGRWSAYAQPLTIIPSGNTLIQFFDPAEIPQSLRFDLSPDEGGEVVAIAIKQEGDREAYAFTSESYAAPDTRRLPELRLDDEAYDVHVVASSGGVIASRSFTLRNRGRGINDLSLE